MKRISVTLKAGTPVIGDFFDKNDYQKIVKIFNKWQELNFDLKSLGGRTLNVPDVVSEALYCVFFNAIRTNNSKDSHSYDAVDIKTGKGVQVKSSSIKYDLTSFGPKSTWDKLIFIDFAPNGVVDGNIYVYEIKNDISKIILNKGKSQTFKDQQEQGRRPRFSLKKEIIEKKKLKPIKKIYIGK